MSDVVVLCYHAVSDDWPADLTVRPASFESQIELMLERGYRGSTFRQAVLAPLRSKTFVVTFDDAFSSVVDRGLPILQRLGVPATIFAVSRFAERGEPLFWDGIDHWRDGPHAGELESLSWGRLRGLIDAGWEVGSHTVNHPHLTQISEADLTEEMAASRRACEEGLGVAVDSIAYPYGDVDERVVAAASAAGYRAGAALPARVSRAKALEWPRIGVYRNDDMRRFKLKVSRAVRLTRLMTRR